jgi:tetratricopeptide (TPR) repeat protein
LEKDATEDQTVAYREQFRVFADMLRSGKSLSGNERNCCFLNVNGQRFADISAIAGVNFPQDGRAIGVTDWDFDGDLDFWLLNRNRPRLQFLRNENPGEGHHVTLRLRGVSSNRDAIGARVEVQLSDSRTLVKTLTAGNGFATQSSKWLHFGLGDDQLIEKLTIRWPGSELQVLTDVSIDAWLTITQGQPTAEVFQTPRSKPLAINEPVPPRRSSSTTRVGMAGIVPTPHVAYRQWDRTLQPVVFPRQRPILINLWASWCAPCLEELKAFADAKPTLAQRIDLLALTMDGVDDLDSPAVAKSRDFLRRIDWPYESGTATLDLSDQLRVLQTPFLDVDDLIPLPTSFLIDKNGSLAAIYQGPVEVTQLVTDVERLEQAGEQPANLAINFPGRWNAFPNGRDQLITLSALYHLSKYEQDSLRFSTLAMKVDPSSELAKRNYDAAQKVVNSLRGQISEFSNALKTQPDNANLYFNLGVTHYRAGDLQGAVRHLQDAIARNQNLSPAHAQLGNVFARMGELDRAEVSLRKALQIAPRDLKAKQALERVLAIKAKRSE